MMGLSKDAGGNWEGFGAGCAGPAEICPCEAGIPRAGPADADFRVENARTGAGVRITSDRPLAKAMLWSIRQVLSVEPLIAIAIEPRGEFTWTIAYQYYTFPLAGGN